MRVSGKGLHALALAIAVALLATSVAWAIARSDDPPRRSAAGWMMGYLPGGDAELVTTIARAQEQARAYADRLGLQVGEVLRFERNFYVVLTRRGGAPATEVLVDPASGAVSLEYGPAMMWNTEYGMWSDRGRGSMMRGMMGRYGDSMMHGRRGPGTGDTMMGGGMMSGAPAPDATGRRLSLGDVRDRAARWLERNQPGTQVAADGHAFPGYVTFETLRDGKIAGMVSVHAASGDVWPHWWHGDFVAGA